MRHVLGVMPRAHSVRPDARSGFLPQIQALRAVAVLAVILFHLWPRAVPGGYVGVDVFFALSGYLITGHLSDVLDGDDRRVSLGAFWSRRARRLLPLSLVVLLATLAGTVLWAPVSLWRQYAVETAAAGAYVVNWRLAAEATDYFGAENLASPVQHYWSLSVEEQFYIGWPLLLVGTAWLARRRRWDTRRALAACIGGIGLVSLAYSVWYSQRSPAAAYFSTFTHAWEFAAGGLAYLCTRGRTATARSVHLGRALLSWGGLGLIVATCFAFDGSTPFPSWYAALPVGGALAVVLAGDATGPLGTSAAFGRPSVQAVGELSYAAYLWHWPLIVLAPFALGSSLSDPGRVIVLGATFALAAASKVVIEDPARFGPAARRLGVARTLGAAGVASLVVVAASVGVVQRAAGQEDDLQETRARLADEVLADGQPCFGARAMEHLESCPGPFQLDPSLDLLASTWPELGTPPTVQLGEGITAERYGVVGGDRRILLVGDSHARMYLPVLEPIAKHHGWELQLVWHGDCSPSTASWQSSLPGDQTTACEAFRRAIAAHLGEVPADLIVTSSVSPRYANHETEATQSAIADAFVDMWRAWTDAGRPVLVIAGVPGPGEGASECFAENRTVDDPCPRPAEEVVERDAMVVAAERSTQESLHLLDLTDAYCTDDGLCHQVVGGIRVYLGGSHLGPAFSLSLAPRIEAAMLAAMGG